jgi:hypothetical protein
MLLANNFTSNDKRYTALLKFFGDTKTVESTTLVYKTPVAIGSAYLPGIASM